MSYSSPEEVLKLARNFMESRILLSGAELNVFTILSHAPLTAKEVSGRTGTDMQALTILLHMPLQPWVFSSNIMMPTAAHPHSLLCLLRISPVQFST